MTTPIKILQVFGALNRAGSESLVMNIYRNIDRSKVQFDFVKHTSAHCAFDDEIKSMGGKIYCAPKFYFFNYFQYRTWWRKFFEQHPEYKIIHGHLFTIASIFFEEAHKYNRITIGHSHATKTPICNIKTILRRPFIKKLSKTSDYRFACSEDAGEWIFGKDCFSVFKNAIESQKYVFSEQSRKKIRDELQLHDKFVIGNIGRLTHQKNQSFLIDIFKCVYKKNKNAILLIIGVGELEHDLRKKARDSGLEKNIVFTGSRSDVPALLSAMDVFVFPSLYEGLGIVAIEAQTAGLPTICADTIPKESNITGLIEFLSLSDSAEKWADHVLKQLKKSERLNMQNEIVAAGYDIKDSTKWMEKFYFSIQKNFS